MKDEGIVYDLLLLQEGGYEQDDLKNQRRTDIEQSGLKIMMRVGDRLSDLYDVTLSNAYSSYFDRFGRDFVIIPNPLYGEWDKGN